MSDDVQIDLNARRQEAPSAPTAGALSETTGSDRFAERTTDSNDAIPTKGSIQQSLTTFRPQYRQMLRVGMAAMLIVLSVEWVVITNRRPDPLLLERGSDFRAQFQVEINSATWVEWLQMEGIGPSLAHRIVADRKLNGPFVSIDDVSRVPGIGPVTLDRIRPWLTMGHDISDARTADAGHDNRTQPRPGQRVEKGVRNFGGVSTSSVK